ncbi:MAG: peptidoglycan DD-metalloendopeptidase family protein [Pelovirga sp.]
MVIRIVTCLLIGLTFYSFPVVGADDLNQTQQQLEQIRSRIERAEADMKAQRQSANDISRDLALINGQLQRIDDRIDHIKQEQQRLKKEEQQQQQQLDQSRSEAQQIGERLEQRLIALYKEGESGILKILFSADSPTELIQQYHYLTKVMENDRELLAEYRQAMATQQRQLERLTVLQRRQAELLQREEAEREEAVTARRLQGRLLEQARNQSRKLRDELATLKEDATRLTGLIDQLKAARVRTPDPATSGPVVDFDRQRGQLMWPVDGSVLIRYGTQRDQKLGTFYESNGLEIAVRPGSQVRAVANGQVVYADFFRGYGNLLIISHEGEYHTLYAQLDKIHKKNGDAVATAEPVGQSGLSGRESIYFEIRHNGAPVDPMAWLQSL